MTWVLFHYLFDLEQFLLSIPVHGELHPRLQIYSGLKPELPFSF